MIKQLSKILPFLSKYIPDDFAIKGITKKVPQYAKFFGAASAAGYSSKSALDFLRELGSEGGSDTLRKNVATKVAKGQGLPAEEEAVNKMASQGRSLGTAKNIGKAAIGAAIAGPGAAALDQLLGRLNLGQEESDQENPEANPQSGTPAQEALRKYKGRKKKTLQEEEEERMYATYGRPVGEREQTGDLSERDQNILNGAARVFRG